ncbi:hypothetical protein DPMN_121631 [Dreissena polymorpha]|uniref:Uncharacterized protein n=1 Tax=Dreissena polymorpha TaxID=45954 RepID=A0A9D4GTX9_DREPO|nr:hypothetical protein DPMN_121631 [Dreissena polymorpha]
MGYVLYTQTDHDLMLAFKGKVRTFWLVSKEGFAPVDPEYCNENGDKVRRML